MAKTAAHPRAETCKTCETPVYGPLRRFRLPAKPICYLQNPYSSALADNTDFYAKPTRQGWAKPALRRSDPAWRQVLAGRQLTKWRKSLFVNPRRCDYSFFLKAPMPKQTEPPAIVRISTNTIINGKFYKRGEPLPFERAEDVPENLKPLLVTCEDPQQGEEPEGARGSFQLNTAYEVGDDDRLGRRLQRKVAREIADLEAKNEREEWLEEEVAAAGELAPEIAQSLEEEHRRHVDQQAAQMRVDAQRSDEASDAAAAAAERPRLYVKRGSRHYAPADKARLRPDEAVYVRQAGRFEYVGQTDAQCEPPDVPIQL